MGDDEKTMPYKYDVTPERVRFQVPSGVDAVDLTPGEWEKIGRELDRALHNVKPLAESELSWIIQRLDGIRDYGTNKPLVQLVNMAKRADGLGYIFRLYESSRDREWNISTYGELDAMERAVRER